MKIRISYIRDRYNIHGEIIYSKEIVVFSGSENAFQIWKKVHAIPVFSKIDIGSRFGLNGEAMELIPRIITRTDDDKSPSSHMDSACFSARVGSYGY